MNTNKAGGPAFPHEYKYGDGTAERAEGMTLRDYFAAKAMQAYCGRKDWAINTNQDETAKISYYMADAMLEARKA